MKNTADSFFLKQIFTMLTTMAKAKTLALKTKTRALKTRLVIFSLLHHNRKILLSSISHKLNTLVAHTDKKSKQEDEESYPDGAASGDSDGSSSVVAYNRSASTSPLAEQVEGGVSSPEKYPDLTHFPFDSEEFEDRGGSVIDLVKSSKEDKGEEFRLEDEIDRVADLYIKRFHRQMRLQKQLSLEDYRDMLERSA